MADNTTPSYSYTNLFHAIFVLFSLSAITLGIWGFINRPEEVPPWPKQISGFAYSPYRYGQSPIEATYPSEQQIDEDLKLLAQHTKHIRTYSVNDILGDIPRIAAKHGILVTVGAWLTSDREVNLAELNKLIEVVNKNKNIDRIIVGNETLLRQELTGDDLVMYINYVRQSINRKVPISTADSWDFWLTGDGKGEHPENARLAASADFAGVHFLPYWLGKNVEFANYDVQASYQKLKSQPVFKNKPIVIGEVGWPSRGREIGDAKASNTEEGKFLRRFFPLAQKENYQFFIMEAFDQPWKMKQEGAVGAYWGVFDADRQPKFAFKGPLQPIPKWRTLVAITIALGILTFLMFLVDARQMRRRAVSFLAAVAFLSTSTLVYMAYQILDPYASLGTIVLGVILSLSAIGVATVLFVEAHEWAEAVWVMRRKRPFGPAPQLDGHAHSKVSIHVPCYNEPPDMVIETIDALRNLRYDNYEVLIIDNNTKDEAVWKPVEAYCAQLNDPRYRFFHVAPIEGFKGGALNFGLKQTVDDAEIIAVIDSDYQVDPDWLRDLVPHFQNPKIAIVQAPQDYRDGDETLFKKMCYAEYRGFFHIGMVTRNDRNAIIQHGTMTMVRRSTLENLGGWGEDTITEDAELGLRVFHNGLEAAYIEKSYGKGLIPDNFIDYRKQRFRWAYGAVQIMRKYARQLFLGGETRLTLGQRYHFVAGWLPWIADGMNLFFTLGALCWSYAMIFSKMIDPPLAVYAIPPLALFFFKLLKLYYVYRSRVGTDQKTTMQAALAGLALSYVISKAMLYGIFTDKIPFLRTPKNKDRESLWFALLLVSEETIITMLLWGAAIGIAITRHDNLNANDLQLWLAALMIQSLPYFAAIVMSIVSSAKPFSAAAATKTASNPG
jgi:exo-beta-1,3-glucanase (GH17 family)/cellulose synthase/poly-beta-1,6-N-acetylglucosamine synthase-like glycosyltransferase